MALHESDKNHVARGLAMQNHIIDLVNDGTAWASATNVATYQSTNLTKEALAHEADKPSFRIANRYMETLNALDIATNTRIAAANTTALWRAAFTAEDATLPSDLHGSRG